MVKFDTRFNKFLVLCAVLVWCGAVVLSVGSALLGHEDMMDKILLSAGGITTALFGLVNQKVEDKADGTPSDPVSVVESPDPPTRPEKMEE